VGGKGEVGWGGGGGGGGACPQTPLVGAHFARTFYIDTSISATNGLSTSYLLPTPLSY